MMQAMGIPPTGQVAIGVAQRSVLQNPGGATGQLQGVGAPTQKRGLSRDNFRKEIAARQITGNTNNQGNTGGTPTNGNNPVATQLLLAPTFTPVQAEAVLDQANMRIAVPVRQVDGEYILIMQKMGGAQAAAPQAAPAGEAAPAAAQPAAAPAAEPAAAAPAAESTARPTAGEPAAVAPAAEASRPAAEPAAASEPASSASPKPAAEAAKTESSAKPEASKAEASPAAKPERRQEKTDKYGNPAAPLGAVVMSMKQIDEMASMVTWGGQAPITQMMNNYVKAQTGKGLGSANSTASAASGLTGITV